MHLDGVENYLRGVAFSFTSVARRIIEDRMALTRNEDGLRPWLVLWSCSAQHGDQSDAVPVAAAFDLFDRFMLLHRELAEDCAPAATRWGLGQSLNAGDALCAIAFRMLAGDVRNPSRRLATAAIVGSAILEAIERSDRTAQSSALTAAALQAGAVIGGATPDAVARYAQAGRFLGAALEAHESTRTPQLIAQATAQIRSVTAPQFVQSFEEVAFEIAGRAA